MTTRISGEQAVKLIRHTIEVEEESRYDADCESLGVLAAQQAWQGHDNCIQFGTVFDWESRGDTPLTDAAQNEIGTGEAVAWVNVDGGFLTLIRETATTEEIEQAAIDCLPSEDN